MNHAYALKWIGMLTLALCCTDSLQAQFSANNNVRGNTAYRGGYRRGAYVPPTYGYPSYYRPTREEGYLSGVANVMNAQGQYGIDYQQARQMNQKSEQEKIKTRRMLMDQRRYEASLRPKPEEVREAKRQERLKRALNQPPLDEILSGQTLNTLLADQKQQMASGLVGPTVYLSPSILKNINVTSRSQGGNAGLLKQDGHLEWPIQLKSKEFASDRQAIESLMSQAVQETGRNDLSAETLQELEKSYDRMNDRLLSKVKSMSLSDYIAGKKYMQELDSGIQALKSPGASNYFNGKWSAEGRTVAELVDNMSQRGLVFASSTRGDGTAYQSLYQSMLSYQMGVLAMLPKSERPSSNSPGEKR